jgi:hypothetical protein
MLPFVILVGMSWYLITLILERRTILESIKILIQIFIRQRRRLGGGRSSYFIYLTYFVMMLILFTVAGRVPQVRDVIQQATASIVNAGQAVVGQLISSPAEASTSSATFYTQIMTYSSAILLAATILVSMVLVVGGAVGGLRALRNSPLEATGIAVAQTVAAIRHTARQLQEGGNYYELILQCYKRMCDLLTAHGAPAHQSQTPREFEVAAAKILPVSPHSLRRLTRLFEIARYSSHTIDPLERSEALECLHNIEAELTEGVPNVPE